MGEGEAPYFGELLRQQRTERGWTQEELCRRSGLSVEAIGTLERGVRQRPRRATIHLLAHALELNDADRLWFEAVARQSSRVSPHGRSGPESSATPSTAGRLAPPKHVHGEATHQTEPLPIGSFLGALPAGPILGREHEVERVLSMIDMVAGGTGQLALLSGEAGVGKTRLAQEVDLKAHNHGFLVASGRCYEQQQATALFPMIAVLTSLFTSAPASIRVNAGRRWPYLGRLLPQQVGPYHTAFGGPNDEQRLFYAVTGFLQAVAAAAPVALLIDDLHWADSSSLALFQHLARHTRGNRVFLLGTFRDVEVGYQQVLKGALQELHREGLVAQVDVRRLDVDATSALVATILGEDHVSVEFTRLIHERSEGNPYFAEHLLRALMERGEHVRSTQSWDRKAVTEMQVPESVRAVIGQRFGRLSITAQSILRDASVLGQTFIFDDLAAMEGRTEEDVDDGLEEATYAGMVRVMGHDAYAFDHALTQQTLYAELSSRRKQKLHRQAGAVLESLPERQRDKRVAELAWHYQQGHDARKAIPWTMLAGDQAEAVFSHRDAELRYRTVLELANQTHDQNVRAVALTKLGRVLKVIGRYDDSLQVLEQSAMLCHEAGDESGELRAVAQIGHVHAVRGTPGEGVTRLQLLIEALEGNAQSMGLADLYVALAKLYVRSGRYREQLTAAGRAVDLARIADDDHVLAQALQQRAYALTFLGHVEEGLLVHEEAIVLAERVGDLASLSNNLHNVSHVLLLQGSFEASRRYKDRGVAAAERLGDPVEIMFQTLHRVFTAYWLCEWHEAHTHYERGMKLSREIGLSYVPAFALLVLGLVNYGEGNWEVAAEYLTESSRVATRSGDLQVVRLTQSPLAERDLLEGRPDAARARLTPLLDRPGLEERDVTLLLPRLAWAQLDLGNSMQAEDLIAQAVRRARAGNFRLALAEALRVQALIAARAIRWTEAFGAIEEAKALSHHLGYHYGEARALATQGELHRERGELPLALDLFAEALTIFVRLGTQKDIERTQRMLTTRRSNTIIARAIR